MHVHQLMSLHLVRRISRAHTYATIAGRPSFLDALSTACPPPPSSVSPTPLDTLILASLSRSKGPPLSELLQQQSENSGKLISTSLLSEPKPNQTRRCDLAAPAPERGLVLIAHTLVDSIDDTVRTITLSTGFALEATESKGESLILGCLHTLHEIRRALSSHSSSHARSGSFVISPSSTGAPSIWPIHGVASSLPFSDLAVFRTRPTTPLRTIPVSLYPAQPYTPITFQLLHDTPTASTFLPGLDSSRVEGSLLVYHNAHGREASPGTYDSLVQMLFTPQPTPGASGGPLVDDAGAVVGIVTGSRWEGGPKGRTVGLAVPAEAIFEMFELLPRKT